MDQNPYLSSTDHGFAEPSASQSDGDGEASPAGGRPRVWPIPLVLVICFCTYLAASVVAVVLAAWVVQGPVDAPFFGERGKFAIVTQSPLGLSITLVLPQIAMAIPALLAAFASPVPLTERLGLVRGHWPLWLWCTAAMATPLVGMISSSIVGALLGESETLDEIAGVFRSLSEDGYLIPLAFMVGLTPGVLEELVFRGYMQTRLTSAWGAPLGILATSLVFAVFHMDLVHSVAVIALGVYLGWIAWASGSILPAMLAHFLNNFLSVLAVVLLPDAVAEGAPPAVEEVPATAVAVLAGVVLLGAVCLLVTLFQGFRYGRRSIAAAP